MPSINYEKYALSSFPTHKKGELVRYDISTREWYVVSKSIKPVNQKKDKRYMSSTTPSSEKHRHLTFIRVKETIESLLNTVLKNRKKSTELFYSWHWHVQLAQPTILDPIIPYEFDVQDQSLIAIFEQKGIPSTKIKNLLRTICTLTTRECNALYKKINTIEKNKKKSAVEIVQGEEIVYIEYETIMLKLHYNVYTKLKHKYNGQSFHDDLFCMLLRYETLGSTTSQAALPVNIFQFLEEYMNIKQEMFASPLNAYFPIFNSAFYDTDSCFGSIGSFFDFFPEKGYYEVNPPFNEIFMQRMVEHIEYLLSNTRKILGFVVIVPRWDDEASPMWKTLTQSFYTKDHFDIPPNRHYYFTGDSFRVSENERMWKARHTTSIFFLSNRKVSFKFNIEKEIKKKWISSF